MRLGFALPALAVRRGKGASDAPEPVLLYMGIIDYLQDYNLRKHLEHAFKKAVHLGEEVSVANPDQYASRFLEFMGGVFRAEPV